CLWDNCQHREEIDSKDVPEHLKEHHRAKPADNIQCLWPGCTSSRKYTPPVLVKHVRGHMKVLQVRCPNCSKPFARRETLMKHLTSRE
ncbi:hypothetical protein C8J57DRAFT_967531, partial [Mycena rebaudengoi]